MAAGFYAQSGTAYDLWALLESIGRRAASVANAAVLIEAEVGPRLVLALNDAKRKDPIGFAADFKAEFLAVAVGGLDGGRPVLAGRDFFPDGGRVAVGALLYPPPSDPAPPVDAVGFTIMGEREAIDRDYPLDKLVPALRTNAIDTVKKLIRLQIAATPAKVGPPLSLLEITPAGINWIERGACR